MSLGRRDWSWSYAGALALSLALAHGCGQTVNVGLDDPQSMGGASSAGAGGAPQLGGQSLAGGAGMIDQAGAPPCEETPCQGKLYQCGNCSDDDGDGLADDHDPECLGPCDDDELGLSNGLPRLAATCKQDCYFDGDNGSGNDKCEWSHSCDPQSLPPDYPPSGLARCEYDPTDTTGVGVDCEALNASQPASCLDACAPLLPNGCDCFGCCELPGGSGDYHFIGAGSGEQGCQLDALDDPVACPPCTPVDSCFNACETCETCVGRLPDPSCSPESACPSAQDPCGPETLCRPGTYCVTGCCVSKPPA